MARHSPRETARRTAALLALALLPLAACVQVYPPQTGPSAAGAEEKEDEEKAFKPWKEVLRDTRRVDGYFTFHVKREDTLYLELAPDQLERDFGLVMHIARGVGVFNLHQGLPLSDVRLMRFVRRGDRLFLVHRNPRFTAEEGTPMRASLEGNLGHSVAKGFPIASEHDTTEHLLVDVTPLFVSDYGELGEWLRFYFNKKKPSFDKERSYIAGAMGFPENVEIDALLTFAADSLPLAGDEGLPDPRSIPVGVRYSIFRLPEQPMRIRLADDRIGHFLDAVKDFSRDREEDPYVRYVNRWRLEKEDHSVPVSEPVEPIVYYVDRSVPDPYRRYVKEGIEAWNKAFEAAGYRNAIVARDPPPDSAWSAEDIRYSTVRWTAAHQMGYAIGPSQTDPRTGEILNADILISSTFVRGWLYDYQELVGPRGSVERLLSAERRMRNLPPHLARRLCLAVAGMEQQVGLLHAALVGLGTLSPGEGLPEEYLGAAIRDLVMHEVGHTLGLRHNFRSSSGVPYERLHDTTFTGQNGVALSVMDYTPVNVALDPTRQGHFFNVEVGSYDVWAIRYAYAPIYEGAAEREPARTGTPIGTPEAELPGLRRIAERSADPLHTYGTDEDNWLGPWAVDPLTNGWDLGSDPLRHALDRAALVEEVVPRLADRLVAEGEAYPRLRQAVTNLIFERLLSALPVTKWVGGMEVARDHRGQPGERPAFRPIPAARQREAVRVLVETAFAEDAFRFDPGLLNRLAPSRWAEWASGYFRTPVDYPVHELVAETQGALLGALLAPPRLARMLDNEVRTPAGAEAYALSELFQTLTGAIWSEVGRRGSSPTSFRRNLQRMHLDALVEILLSPGDGAPEDARSLARLELAQLSSRLGAAVEAEGLDRATVAHFAESKARVDRALEAALVLTRGG